MRTMQWGIRTLPCVLMLATLAGCASRSPEPSRDDALDEGELFEIIDRDRNGAVTEEEFVSVYEDHTAARREFARLDTNHDRVLSRDEFGNVRLFLVRW